MLWQSIIIDMYETEEENLKLRFHIFIYFLVINFVSISRRHFYYNSQIFKPQNGKETTIFVTYNL